VFGEDEIGGTGDGEGEGREEERDWKGFSHDEMSWP
jgi:hypothetical protein